MLLKTKMLVNVDKFAMNFEDPPPYASKGQHICQKLTQQIDFPLIFSLFFWPKMGAERAKIRPPERILELLVVTGSSGYLR